jgi:cytochrome P450
VHEAFNRYQRHAQPATLRGLYGFPRRKLRAQMDAAAADVHALFAPILDARLAQLATGAEPPADILQTLIAARHPQTGAPFSRQDLLDQLAIIFLAGHETSASALGWTLWCLAASPALQTRLLAEIADITNGQALAFDHLKRLDGVRNLFREGLRLYPPVSFYPREVTRPLTRRNKRLRPGDMVVVSPWLIQRSENHWACPHAFDPDRFTRPDGAEASREGWLPFGRGPRICVGAGFAQQEAVLILAEIIRAFALAPDAAHRPEIVSRLTLRPRDGIRLALTARDTPQ